MKNILPKMLIILIFVYLLLLVRPLFLGQLGGTFQTHPTPQDYTKLATFLSEDETFSHTLWIPVTERFGFFSFIHPSISSYDFFQTTTIPATFKKLQNPAAHEYLADASIQYLIVPEDSQKEIFLKDRKYDNTQYLATIAALQKISWLRELSGFGGIHVFAVIDARSHFWVSDSSTKVTEKDINPTQFVLSLKNVKKGDKLIFTDAYDSGWQLQAGKQIIATYPFHNLSNSFILPKSGSYIVTLTYAGQKWVVVGVWVSIVSLFLLLSLWFIISKNSAKPQKK